MFFKGDYVSTWCPTGYGIFLIYQAMQVINCLSFLEKNVHYIFIVAPVKALMEDQVGMHLGQSDCLPSTLSLFESGAAKLIKLFVSSSDPLD